MGTTQHSFNFPWKQTRQIRLLNISETFVKGVQMNFRSSQPDILSISYDIG